jgi:guanylate kinase
MSITGNLFIISAPSGGGKTSIVNALLLKDKQVKVSISYTTREKRHGEVEGENYFFVSKETFQAMIQSGEFLEYAEVFGHYYGTARSTLQAQQQAGYDVLLEIDWQGARQIKSIYPTAIGVFILPPSLDILQGRLERRGRDSVEIIQKRMMQAVSEMSHYDEYDYMIVNKDFDTAVEQLSSIIKASRLKLSVQVLKNAQLLHDLLI